MPTRNPNLRPAHGETVEGSAAFHSRHTRLTAAVFLLSAGLSLLLSGCMDRTVFHHCQSVPQCVWQQEDTLLFRPDTLAPGQPYTLQVQARILQDYPYRQLQILVEHNLEKEPRADTLLLQITDTAGVMLGRQIFLHQVHTATHTFTPQQSRGWIRIRHLMRREALPGISDIGIRLQKAD